MLDTSPTKFRVKRTVHESSQHNQTFMGSNVDPTQGVMNHLIGHKLNNTMKSRQTVEKFVKTDAAGGVVPPRNSGRPDNFQRKPSLESLNVSISATGAAANYTTPRINSKKLIVQHADRKGIYLRDRG